MSRYLTAGKLGLLMVVAIYCDGWAPKDGTIPVLSFITSRLAPELAEADKSGINSKSNGSLTLEDFKNTLKPFQKYPNAANLWEVFVIEAWRTRDLDELFEFFRKLPELFSHRKPPIIPLSDAPVQQVCLLKTSMIGTFVRRAVLEFDRLSFQETVSLWQSYEAFRKPTTVSNPNLSQISDDSELSWDFQKVNFDSEGRISALLNRNRDDSLTDCLNTSSSDVEKLLKFQIDKIQSSWARFCMLSFF